MNQNNDITINSHTTLINQFDTIEWIIDTTPDYNLTNTHFIRPIYQVSNENSITNNMDFTAEDDYIPFESQTFKRVSIETEVRDIIVSEEEKKCCICYEIKQKEDISQINCGHKFCGHKFCGTCIIDHISINYKNPCCPLCRAKICHVTFQRDFYQHDFKDL
jgi:hypothetical protein